MFDDALADEVIEQLGAVDPAWFDDDGLRAALVEVERIRAAVDALALRLIGAADRRQVHQADGAVSLAGWLAQRTQVAGSTARRRVRTARGLTHLPVVRTAVEGGALAFEQAEIITRLHHPSTEAALARDETMLVDLAGQLRVDQLARAVRIWRAHADPDGTAPPAGQHLDVARTWHGRVVVTGELDAGDGEVVAAHLEQLADQLHRTERTLPPELRRTAGELRAAALVEMARRSSGTTPASRARPAITLIVRADDLAAGRGGVTSRGDHLPPSTVQRFLCDARVRALIVSPSGHPLAMGRRSRTFTPAQRAAIEARDDGRAFPGCDRPPGWCDAHHLLPYDADGPTDVDNGALLCHRHHHLCHEGGFRLARAPDGQLSAHRPDGTPINPDPGLDHGRARPGRPGAGVTYSQATPSPSRSKS